MGVKSFFINLILLFCLTLTLSAQIEGESRGVRRYGLFVGVNAGGTERQTLRWAVSDATKLSQVMTEVGGILPGDSIVLEDPGNRAMLSGFDRIERLMNQDRENARRVEFLFYYSGHSDESGLLLGDEHLSYEDLREKIQAMSADVSIAILDSCASGAFTRSKGGQRTQPFLVGDNSEMSGHAYLTSSSDDELSQESDRISASYFTYYMISGLRGAADRSGDRKVTLNEAYEYAFNETLAVTSSTMSGPQHPSYNIQLSGSGDLVLTDLNNPVSSIVLDSPINGRVYIKDGRGGIIAEINKSPDSIIELAVDPGIYTVELNSPDYGFFRYQFNLEYQGQKLLTMGDFTTVSPVVNRTRGGDPIEPLLTNATEEEGQHSNAQTDTAVQPSPNGEDDFFDNEADFFDDEGDFFDDDTDFFDDENDMVSSSTPKTTVIDLQSQPAQSSQPVSATSASSEEELERELFQKPSDNTELEHSSFVFTLVPGIGYPANDPVTLHSYVAFSPFILNIGSVSGAAIGWMMGTIEGQLLGAAYSSIGLYVKGNTYGASIAGIYTIGNSHVYGSQVSGVFNIAREQSTAVQVAGVFNLAEEPLHGAQIAGVFNSVDYQMDGVQIAGIYNQSEIVNGVQLSSVLNVTSSLSGLQLGTINTAKNANGVQAGIINIATGRVNGVQLGLFNYADDLYGVPIGLFSWVRKGIHDISYWGEGGDMHFFGLANGSRNVYTTVYAGISKDDTEDDLTDLTVGIGWGLRYKFEPFYMDMEAGIRRGTIGDNEDERINSIFDDENKYVYPSFRIMTGFEVFGIGFFLGYRMDIEFDDSFSGSNWEYNGSSGTREPLEDLGVSHQQFIWGVRI